MMSSLLLVQVVHGDMKSQNVLLTRNWDIAKIADVGVARFARAVDVAGNDDLASAVRSPPVCLNRAATRSVLVLHCRRLRCKEW